jgi:hypothetical protein
MAEKPRFQIQMKAAELTPERVRASDLADFLNNLEGAITETAKSQDIPLAYDPDEVLVSLVGVESGNSSDLLIAVALPISPVVSIMTRAIADRNFASLPHETQECLHNISNNAIRMRLAYEFRPVNGLLVTPTEISYEYPVPKPTEVLTTTGSTTVWGNLVKVGGDSDPKAIVRLRNDKLFAVRITRDMVSEIQEQKLIYKDIGFKGVATWKIENWAMKTFKATSIVDYRPDTTNLVKSFRDLSEASEGRWETVDPVEHVKKLRSEEA